MQYKVPQFIEVEDKIFGPLTFKQFLYIAGGGGVALMLVTLLPFWLALILAAPFVAAGGALAFYKINDRPLIVTIEHAFSYFTGHKLYLWKHRPENPVKPSATGLGASSRQPHPRQLPPAILAPKFTESKLKDLAWSLNIKDRLAEGEAQE